MTTPISPHADLAGPAHERTVTHHARDRGVVVAAAAVLSLVSYAAAPYPEDPIPTVGDGILLEDLDDGGVDAFLSVAGPGSPLLAAELRQLGGALAASPAGAGARGTSRDISRSSARAFRALRPRLLNSTVISTATSPRWGRGRRERAF